MRFLVSGALLLLVPVVLASAAAPAAITPEMAATAQQLMRFAQQDNQAYSSAVPDHRSGAAPGGQ